jgi:hypothetical protein
MQIVGLPDSFYCQCSKWESTIALFESRGQIMTRLAAALTVCAGSMVLAVIASGMAGASETVNYTYDAKGRLVKVAHSGTVNNNVVANYSFDHADNRVNVNVTGAP